MAINIIHPIKIFFKEFSEAISEHKWSFIDLVDSYEQYHNNIETHNLRRARLIEDWIEKNSTLLDAGVGDGQVALYLSKSRNAKVFGIDISENACKKARDLGINAEVRDMTNGLSLQKNEIFDYVLLSEVIEHTVYPQKILLDALEHSKKGVIVTIPNSAYFKWRIHLLRGHFPRQSFTHLHYWSIKDFEIFCMDLGIKILEFKTFPPKIILKFRNLLAWQQCWLLSPKK